MVGRDFFFGWEVPGVGIKLTEIVQLGHDVGTVSNIAILRSSIGRSSLSNPSTPYCNIALLQYCNITFMFPGHFQTSRVTLHYSFIAILRSKQRSNSINPEPS